MSNVLESGRYNVTFDDKVGFTMRNKTTGATTMFVRDEEGLFSAPLGPEPKNNKRKALIKGKTVFQNKVKKVSKPNKVLKKVEHRAANIGSSSHALLAGVDETAIKEESNIEGDSRDDQRLEDNPMGGCVPLPGMDEADIKDDINIESDVKDEVDIKDDINVESDVKDGADIKDNIKVESDVNDQSCFKKDFKDGDDQRSEDNPMEGCIPLPGVDSHYEEESEKCLEPNAEQIFRKDVLLAGVEDSRNDETKQEKDELVSRKDGALTPGVVCEDLEPEERYALTPEVERKDPEPEAKNPRDDVKSESKVCASTNHTGSHKAEALKDMGRARVATGRVPIMSASVKKPDKENWKTNSTSQFEAMLTLGRGAGNHIECHKVEALKEMSKARAATKSTSGQCK
jgi:hypothetical protein